jgi:hypothetical protein
MKIFSMSQYSSIEALLEDRSVYYENLTYLLAEKLVESGVLYKNGFDDYYWSDTGELLG